MLRDMDTLEVDDNVISSDGGKVMFDFILSEDISCKPDVENVVDSENHNDLLDQYATSVKGDSNVMKGHGEGKSLFCDVHQKTNVEKLSVFAESMTSDLEFFLHPSNYTKGRACTTGNKPGDSNAPDTVDQETFYVKTQMKPQPHSVPEQFADKIEACASIPAQSTPVSLESEQNVSCCLVNPKTAIVVNTRNFNEEMIISRRSTYQKILEMEQEGAKVVERDLGLPIDLVISSAVCLAWYDSRNIARKSLAPDAAACPSLPLCVESLAADILTSLSFAFSCCILIFEGEANFLNEIMESSDELIAAAASLGIDVQLFYSHSSELTEEIIFSCINVAAKSGVFYPVMSDSESLGESFLTAFPSLNPLSANAILSSDAILCKFMEMSNELRIRALQKYMVPSESIALLSATARYGEREDSKSSMTDCSSSISAPEREDVLFRGESQRNKKPKHLHMHDAADDHPEEKFPTESVKAFQGDRLFDSWLTGFDDISAKTAPLGDFVRGSDPDMTNFFLNGIRKRPCMNMTMPQEEISHSPRNRFGSKPNATTQYNKGIDFAPENFNGELIDAKGKAAVKY
ncbi:hypothetical protein M569_09792 [Genlisea aurea]|uniref:Uncharacterized protein n=1 Tax=Genlisea aurea TaxID=192259 RepID=S8CDQ7_9LAMI|nr:hypothetical protein M569_09792 [Genlisea aurea]